MLHDAWENQVFGHGVDHTTLAFTSCCYRPSRSAKGESFRAFSGVSWAGAQSWTCPWPSRFPGIWRSFSKPLFSTASHSSAFPPEILGLSIIHSNCYLLPAAAMTKTFTSKWLWPTPQVAVDRFQVRWNKNKPFRTVFFQGAKQQVKGWRLFVNEIWTAPSGIRRVGCYFQGYCWSRKWEMGLG